MILLAALVVPVLGLGEAEKSTAAAQEEVAVVTTSYGKIVWRFFPREAPGHTTYVKELIRRGFYDGTSFHRAIPHFVIQGGDPNSKDDDRANDGEGAADRLLKAEFSSLHYRPGTVGMARDADPDSGSCQFFIALTDLPRLDGRYTIFGEVISGLDVALRIAQVPRDLNDNPLEPVRVIVRLEKRKVTSEPASSEPAKTSGEVLTGPAKPRPYDPGNVLWNPPTLKPEGSGAGPHSEAPHETRLDLTLDEAGTVLDVRFTDIHAPAAATLRTAAFRWRFDPALYAGHPQKIRFEMDGDGTRIGPPSGSGVPIEIGEGIVPPKPVVRVAVPAGVAPPKGIRLRLSIDASGAVLDATLQGTTGNVRLDEQAIKAAQVLAFAPAMRRSAKGKEPEPVSVYLDVEAQFVATGP